MLQQSFQFDSFSAFMSMSGHGIFVWSVYGLTLLVLVSMLLSPLRKKRRFFIEQAMLLRRQQNSPTAPGNPTKQKGS